MEVISQGTKCVNGHFKSGLLILVHDILSFLDVKSYDKGCIFVIIDN